MFLVIFGIFRCFQLCLLGVCCYLPSSVWRCTLNLYFSCVFPVFVPSWTNCHLGWNCWALLVFISFTNTVICTLNLAFQIHYFIKFSSHRYFFYVDFTVFAVFKWSFSIISVLFFFSIFCLRVYLINLHSGIPIFRDFWAKSEFFFLQGTDICV